MKKFTVIMTIVLLASILSIGIGYAQGNGIKKINLYVSDEMRSVNPISPLHPILLVQKNVNPTHIPEPGGQVTFSVVLTNVSTNYRPLIITSLVDDIHGNLNGQGTCSVPQTIPLYASYTCEFTAQVTGNAGYVEVDTVTASGTDDGGWPVSGSDDAMVTITPVDPVINVVKTAEPESVPEPGGEVVFTVSVTNNSGPTDPVTITSLVDSIYGDLNGQGTCSVPQTIQPGGTYTCQFSGLVSGNAGDVETNVVTASGTDDEGTPVSDEDDATVTITPNEDGIPEIEVIKTADPTLIPEPGGVVTFTVSVTNNSSPTDPVTITSLMDDIHGDLNGQGTCSVPQTIQPGDTYTCQFTATVTGNAGYSETDVVTASGTDDEGYPVEDSDDATVTITTDDGFPEIDVQKDANPEVVGAPGGEVTFTVVVTNNSSPTDPVTITSLIDDIHGDLNGKGTCSVPQTIQPGASYTCQFTAMVSGNAGDVEIDTVTASGHDDEGYPVEDSDDATVTIALYKVYFPNMEREESVSAIVPMTIGFEDLEFDRPDMDFDYNDWVANIDAKLLVDENTQDLYRINFAITPRARGGVRAHAFHILIPANTFASNGVATLTIRDQNGHTVSSTQTPFIASQENDFVVIPCTCDAFPAVGEVINAFENKPLVITQRTAELSIEFYKPGPFDLSYFNEEKISAPHGTGLFFDPYLEVLGKGLEIHQGDLRLLSVPDINWMWPEERVRIDRAYPNVTGEPPDFVFADGWWNVHNTCVYGDGIKCPSSNTNQMPME